MRIPDWLRGWLVIRLQEEGLQRNAGGGVHLSSSSSPATWGDEVWRCQLDAKYRISTAKAITYCKGEGGKSSVKKTWAACWRELDPDECCQH